ncbi:hypothetical protein [Nocardia testacea]|uniref:hypothetical protein n=1 Tax=Nocardia testacea TaxID=248551 RepID=UPI003F4D261C
MAWVQEEPASQDAWPFFNLNLPELLRRPRCISRRAMNGRRVRWSPPTGPARRTQRLAIPSVAAGRGSDSRFRYRCSGECLAWQGASNCADYKPASSAAEDRDRMWVLFFVVGQRTLARRRSCSSTAARYEQPSTPPSGPNRVDEAFGYNHRPRRDPDRPDEDD